MSGERGIEHGAHSDARPLSGHDGLRRVWPRALLVGILLSGALHLAGIAWFSVEPPGDAPEPVPAEMVILPPHEEAMEESPTPPTVELPPSPDPIPRPATPVAGAVENPEIPELIPHEVPPRLVNAVEVQRRLLASYPDSLRDSHVEGLVVLWLYVDEAGDVRQQQLRRSSGVWGLDATARDVARSMAFSPALNHGKPIGVWVSQPIRFQVRPPTVAADTPAGDSAAVESVATEGGAPP